jgi:photosystem II stability/assembly factor-like uncharacterized protein
VLIASTVVFLLAGGARAQLRPWLARGPYGGTVNGLEVDPRHPSIVYATSSSLYKSTNAGRTWHRTGPPVGTVIGPVEVALSQPSTLYAFGPRHTLLVSKDGARSWRPHVLPGSEQPDDLEVDSHHPERVYMAGAEGLFRTDDAGSTWRRLRASPTQVVEVAPSASNVVYISASGELLRSTDTGATWARVWAEASGLRQLAVDPQDPATIFLEQPGGVFKLVAGQQGPTLLVKLPAGRSEAGIAIDPTDHRRIFAALTGLVFSSADGGATWRRSRGLPPFEQIFDVKVSPGGPAYVAFLYHGVFKSSDGRRWRPTSNGIVGTTILSLAADESSPSIAYAGMEEAGVARSTDGGVRWPVKRLPLFFIYSIASAPRLVYAGGFRHIYRSSNHGRTWRSVWSRRDGTITALAAAPRRPNVIYAGGGLNADQAGREGALYRSNNAGASWRFVTRMDKVVRVLAVVGRSPRSLVVGSDLGLFTSKNGGRTWRAASGVRGRPDAIAVSPSRSEVVYLGTDSVHPEDAGVYRSLNGGRTWKNISAGLPARTVFAVAVDPRRPGTVYAGACDEASTSGGVFRRTAASRRWTKISGPMPSTCVTALALTASGQRLLVGTRGGGVYSYGLR